MDSGSESSGDYFPEGLWHILISNEQPLLFTGSLKEFSDILLLNTTWLSSDINASLVAILAFVVLILLFFSALVSGSEVAFFSLSPQQLAELDDQNTTAGNRILYLLRRPQQLLATILIANNLFNIGMIVTFYVMLSELLNDTVSNATELWLNTLLITPLLVLFGEILPKVYANFKNLQMAEFTSVFLSALYQLFFPASRFLAFSTTILEKKLNSLRQSGTIDQEEIEQAIDLVATNSDDNDKLQELEMLKGIVTFRNITVKQIMTNRLDIFGLDDTIPFHILRSEVVQWGYSRVPVYTETIDNIRGMLYVKDLLEHLNKENNFEWQQLLRPAMIVPDSKKIYDLMKEMQGQRTHIAIVVDEYGGTSGLISMEDILEEIVGDIRDEYDEGDDVEYERINRNSFIFDGRTTIHDVCKVMRIDRENFADVEGEAESIGGVVLEISGRFLKEGDSLQFNHFTFTVTALEKNRIEKVRIDITTPSNVNADNNE